MRFLQDLVILVLRAVSFNTVLTDTTFPCGSEAGSREELVGASLYDGTLSSTTFSGNTSNNSGKSRNGSHRIVVLILILFFVFCWFWRRVSPAWLLILSLRVDVGRNVGITASYGSDAGDVGVAELEEPVDKPWTTIGT